MFLAPPPSPKFLDPLLRRETKLIQSSTQTKPLIVSATLFIKAICSNCLVVFVCLFFLDLNAFDKHIDLCLHIQFKGHWCHRLGDIASGFQSPGGSPLVPHLPIRCPLNSV